MKNSILYAIKQEFPKNKGIYYLNFLQCDKISFKSSIYEASLFKSEKDAIEELENNSLTKNNFEGFFTIEKLIKREYEETKKQIIEYILKGTVSQITAQNIYALGKLFSREKNIEISMVYSSGLDYVFFRVFKSKSERDTEEFDISVENILNWKINGSSFQS
jgi:hypothetical protein